MQENSKNGVFSLQLGAKFTWVLLHPDAPFISVPRPARCNVYHDAAISSVSLPPQCNVYPGSPLSSVPYPARCAVHLGAPSARCSLQFGVPFRSVPPSAACPGQLPSSATTTAGHLAATCNTVNPLVTYSARNVFISFVILSE
jgi:hypothetical protein